MEWRDHIVSEKDILMGKPVLKGTRISVEVILDLLSDGWSEAQLFESYPNLTREQLIAVFAFVRDGVQQDLYMPVRRSA